MKDSVREYIPFILFGLFCLSMELERHDKQYMGISNAIALGACAEAHRNYELTINISGVGTYSAILTPTENLSMLDIISRLRQMQTVKGTPGDRSLLLDAKWEDFTNAQCPTPSKDRNSLPPTQIWRSDTMLTAR